MAEKKSFLMYTDYYEQIKMLTLEQRGALLTAIMAYQVSEDLPEMDAMTKMAFSFISADMRRDNEKYEEIVERRRESGRKGGYQKAANQREASLANVASASFAKTNLANVADNVNVNDNENVNDNGSVSVNVNERATRNTQHTDTQKIPTVTQLKAYCLANAIVTDVEKFYQYNSAKNWPMRWQDALALWVKKDQEQQTAPKRKFNSFNDNIEKHNFTQDYFDNLERMNADRLEKIAHEYMERSQQA